MVAVVKTRRLRQKGLLVDWLDITVTKPSVASIRKCIKAYKASGQGEGLQELRILQLPAKSPTLFKK